MKRTIMIGVGLLVFCCGFFAVASMFVDTSEFETSGNNVTSGSSNTTETDPDAKPTPQPTAPPIEEIIETVDGMTDAQRNRYNQSITGSRVEGWVGTVTEVDEAEVFGGFTVYVDMMDENIGSEVFIDVSEDVALSLNLNQEIEFSGDISTVSDLFGTSVRIENAIISTKE